MAGVKWGHSTFPGMRLIVKPNNFILRRGPTVTLCAPPTAAPPKAAEGKLGFFIEQKGD